MQIFKEPAPYSYLTVGLDVYIPDADDIRPRVQVDDFHGVQPYKIIMVGEKVLAGAGAVTDHSLVPG